MRGLKPRAPVQRFAAWLVLAALPACGGVDETVAHPIRTIEGFDLPETVLHDAERDAFYVSCMVGNPTAKDGNGLVVRVQASPPWTREPLLVGGKNGVTLDGPKGMALDGDVLWVADIDALRAFDLVSGAPVAEVDLAPHGARALNDVALHPDGSLFATDPQLVFADDGTSEHVGEDRIFRLQPDGTVEVALRGDALGRPNGIAWEPRGRRFLIAPLEGKDLLEWRPGVRQAQAFATGPGRYDGIEVEPGGRILVSTLDGGIHAVEGGALVTLLDGLDLPGNFAACTNRPWTAIPMIGAGRVEVWRLPTR